MKKKRGKPAGVRVSILGLVDKGLRLYANCGRTRRG